MISLIQQFATFFPVLIMGGCALLPFFRGVPGYSLFLEGAKEGALAAVHTLPALLALLCALRIWGATGLGDNLAPLLSWVSRALGMPADALPLILLRPFTGGGSLGVLGSLLTAQGPDSPAGRLASAVMGCTETYFYTATIYYAAAGHKMGRGMLWRAAVAQLVAVLTAALLCNLFF